MLIVSFFFFACNKTKLQENEEAKVEEQKIKETSSTSTDPQIEKLRNNLKNGLKGNNCRYQESRMEYEASKESDEDDDEIFEMLYCYYILKRWAYETAESDVTEYNFEDVASYALNLGVSEEALDTYKESDQIYSLFMLVDEIRSYKIDEHRYNGEVIVPETSWKHIQKTNERKVIAGGQVETTKPFDGLLEYDLDNNGVKELLSLEIRKHNEISFSMAMNGSRDIKNFFKIEKLKTDNYYLDLENLIRCTVDLIDYDGDNIPELVASFQDINYNSCVYLFVYDKKDKIYKESFNMETLVYSNVENFGYCSSEDDLDLFWVYKDGKFLEVGFNQIKNILD
ncbi:hypothetical protein KST17_08590 [Fusobacterium canifelinum]